MKLTHLAIFLCLAGFGQTGPIVLAVAEIAAVVGGEAAGMAVAGSSIAAAFGVGASGIFFSGYVCINGALLVSPEKTAIVIKKVLIFDSKFNRVFYHIVGRRRSATP